jgi:hypothetical protein
MRQLNSQEEKQFNEPKKVKAIEIEKLNKFSQLIEAFPLYIQFEYGAWRIKEENREERHNTNHNRRHNIGHNRRNRNFEY